MSVLLVISFLVLLTSLISMHLYNEHALSRRIERAGHIVQELLDQNEIKHIDFEKKFEKSNLSTQIRVIEYYLYTLNSSFNDFGPRKSIFERIATVESILADYYGYQEEMSLI